MNEPYLGKGLGDRRTLYTTLYFTDDKTSQTSYTVQ